MIDIVLNNGGGPFDVDLKKTSGKRSGPNKCHKHFMWHACASY